MKLLCAVPLGALLAAAVLAFAGSAPKATEATPSAPAISSSDLKQQWTVEGEKRFRANCSRCHQSPHKFPPREMAMAIRHMRVRAMLTEDDTRYLLYFVTH
jgi:mono/diheme cytochrome c family protein